jgi:glycosyltransferase involved in cell wall biosynthesis
MGCQSYLGAERCRVRGIADISTVAAAGDREGRLSGGIRIVAIAQRTDEQHIDPGLVTVIVTTRNSARTLEACLASIRSQDHSAIELVVVDNDSTDSTQAIALRYCDGFAVRGPERSAQRNHGAALARGAYVLFIDSDMVLDAGVVSEGIRALRDDEVRAVAIPEVSFGAGYWTRCRILERTCYVGDDDVEAARLFRRLDFMEVGGYDLDLNGAEDWDLSARVASGSKLARTASFIHHDEGRITLRGCYVKRRYYARGYLRYLAKRRRVSQSQTNVVFRPAFFRHWRGLASHPALTGGMFLLKTTELAAVAQVAVEQWVLGGSRTRFTEVYGSDTAAPGAIAGDQCHVR